jgi:uncharacterized membrane-anchored protein
MNIFLDQIYLLALLIGTVILWWAIWNMADAYIPNTLRNNILALLVGVAIIFVFRYFYRLNEKKY